MSLFLSDAWFKCLEVKCHDARKLLSNSSGKKINYKWETKKQNVTNYQELPTLGKGIYDVHYAIFKTFFVGLEFGE